MLRKALRRAAFACPMLLTLVLASGTHAMAPEHDEIRGAIEYQLALERFGFSPGLIDGKLGTKTSLAVADFQRSRKLPVTGKLDDATASALELSGVDPFTTHTVTESDLARVTGPLPKGWLAKSKLKSLGYESPAEALGERFHCPVSLLETLNPKVSLAKVKPGQTLTVPNLLPQRSPIAAPQKLEINFAQKYIRVLDAAGSPVAAFHCSIAKDFSKRPSGPARVATITHNPAYGFDPAMWPEVKDVKTKLLIPPGPRNPVGMCWIGLSLKGYGIHGTPKPEMIGKTGSHGCFRLANWDATRLGNMLHVGTPITFVSTAAPAPKAAARTATPTPTRAPSTRPSPIPLPTIATAE